MYVSFLKFVEKLLESFNDRGVHFYYKILKSGLNKVLRSVDFCPTKFDKIFLVTVCWETYILDILFFNIIYK